MNSRIRVFFATFSLGTLSVCYIWSHVTYMWLRVSCHFLQASTQQRVIKMDSTLKIVRFCDQTHRFDSVNCVRDTKSNRMTFPTALSKLNPKTNTNLKNFVSCQIWLNVVPNQFKPTDCGDLINYIFVVCCVFGATQLSEFIEFHSELHLWKRRIEILLPLRNIEHRQMQFD